MKVGMEENIYLDLKLLVEYSSANAGDAGDVG